MTKVQIIEREIKRLDRASLATFRNWFRQYESEAWDRQIEMDVRAGNLEKPQNFETPCLATVLRCYRSLPKPVRDLADKNFKLLKANPDHPSLHFKKIGKYRSVRVGLITRALAVEAPEGLLWFWIGGHAEYDRLIN